MMTVETAEALILVTVDSVEHRRNCLKGAVRDLPCELLSEALAVLEADGDGEDVREVRQWFADQGIQLPTSPGKAPSGGQAENQYLTENSEGTETPKQHPYVRRANNQVSPETEALIREQLAQGQTKSAIARALRVNRRVVIRVASESQGYRLEQRK